MQIIDNKMKKIIPIILIKISFCGLMYKLIVLRGREGERVGEGGREVGREGE